MSLVRVPSMLLACLMFAFASVGASAQTSSSDQAATVDGAPIMKADVDAKLGNNLAKLQEEIFRLRQKQLDSMIDQALLEREASRRSVTIAALVQTEITSKVEAVTPEDVSKFYEENKTKLQGEFKTLEDQIKNYLAAQRLQARQKEFLGGLRQASKVEVFLTAPPIFRSEVATAGAPIRGSDDAPITIVEFSDFHCPYCRKVQPILDQVRAKYGEKVKLVYRDLPLDNLHPQARAAAEAARCANEQGKFWEFHDKVFKNDPDSSAATLDRFAQELGMDVPAFDACRTSGKYKASVLSSNQEGSRLGLTGTPSFFINGRILVGAQPVEAFSKIIDEELAKGSNPPVARQ